MSTLGAVKLFLFITIVYYLLETFEPTVSVGLDNTHLFFDRVVFGLLTKHFLECLVIVVDLVKLIQHFLFVQFFNVAVEGVLDLFSLLELLVELLLRLIV